MAKNTPVLDDPCDYPWFRKLGGIKAGVACICVRKHPEAPYHWIQVRCEDYIARVTVWLNYLRRYWLQQFRAGSTVPSLTPVPMRVAAGSSWVFGRDLSSSGGFFIRILLAELFGRFKLKLVTIRDVCRSLLNSMKYSV